MTEQQKDSNERFAELTSAIHSMLQRHEDKRKCVSCQSPCDHVIDVQIDHSEFFLTVPLPVCPWCGTQAPFARMSFESLWRQAAIRAIGLFAGQNESRWRPGFLRRQPYTSLQTLLEIIPEYLDLTQAFPELSLSTKWSRIRRRASHRIEVERFHSEVQWRRSTFYLMTNNDVSRSQIPELLLATYPEIIDRQIQGVISRLVPSQNLVAQVSVVLLPGRVWKFQTQIFQENWKWSAMQAVQKLEESLAGIPAWPVAYPVVFVARRYFGRPSKTLVDRLFFPLDQMAQDLPVRDPVSYCELALKAYDVNSATASAEFEEQDIIAICNYLPGNLSLKLLHAEGLRVLDKPEQELALYDEMLQEYPDHQGVIHRRILCLMTLGQLERAGAECQRQIQQNPQDVGVCAMLANIHLGLNQPDESLKQIDTALAVQECAEFHCIRGNILATLGRFDAALTAVNRSIYSDRNYASAYLLRAKLHLHANRHEPALLDLNDHERCGVASLESLHLRIESLVGLKRVTDAEQAFRTALLQAPDNLLLKLEWAEYLGQNGKLELAREECDQILATSPDFGAAYVVRAAVLLETSQYDDCIQDADKAIELLGTAPKAFMLRGLAKASLGRLNDGLEDLDVCIEQAPEYAMGRLHRARLKLGLEESESAVEDLTAALEIVPDWTEVLLERGYVRLKLEDHLSARDDFERVIKISPDRADGYTGRALTYLLDRKKSAASSDLNKAITLDPGNLNSRMNRARLLLEQAEMELAKEDLNEILAVDSQSETALYHRAYIGLYQGEFEAAKLDFDRLIDLNPEMIQAWIGRSVAFDFAGKGDLSDSDYEEAVRLAPYSADQLKIDQVLLLSIVAARCEQFEKSIDLASSIIDEHPEPVWDAYRTRGQARWYSEHFVDALEDFTLIINDCDEVTRQDFSAHGQILCEMGEFERGLESLDRSVEIASDEEDDIGLAYSLNGRGRALVGLGRFEEAMEAFEESRRLKPNNAWLHFNRGLMYVEQSDPMRALACYQEALRVSSPKLPPGKRRRAAGFIESVKPTE